MFLFVIFFQPCRKEFPTHKKLNVIFFVENGALDLERFYHSVEEWDVDVLVLQVVATSLVSSAAQSSCRDLRRDEMPSEIQYVGVLIKAVFSDCELLQHAYPKLACLIMCVRVCLPCAWVSLLRNVHVHIAVIIWVNRSAAGNMFHSTNCWHVYSVSSQLLPHSFLFSMLAVCFPTSPS